jgi:hypothetical protein
MKISRRIIRKLIREAIEDFSKADFVAGTDIDQTAMPRQIFDNISNWLSNNQKSIKKLIAFRKEVDSNPRTRFYGPERTAMLNQYNSLSSGLTSNTITGGMSTNEIKRFQTRYIAFLGDQLVQNHPKLRQYIDSHRIKMNAPQSEVNQLDSLFEVLFEVVDTVGVGPVTYSDYVNAKKSLYELETGRSYYHTSVNRGHDPVRHMNLQNKIFDPNVDISLRRHEFDSEDYSMTSNFNSRNTSITDGLGLYEINLGYEFNYVIDEEYTDYDYDRILEYVSDELYDVPGMITGINITRNENNYPITQCFIIATDEELDAFKSAIDSKVIDIGDLGRDNHTGQFILDIDENILIEPNSMDSIRRFLDPHGAGIPTYSNSAQGIKREHETFLQSALNAAKSYHGNYTFTNPTEEERANSNLDLMHAVLNLKGYDIEGL